MFRKKQDYPPESSVTRGMSCAPAEITYEVTIEFDTREAAVAVKELLETMQGIRLCREPRQQKERIAFCSGYINGLVTAEVINVEQATELQDMLNMTVKACQGRRVYMM